MEKIDFVVTWLDSTDPIWQQKFDSYRPYTKGDKSNARFRNMNIFKYWFRAVEIYAPWVNKIFLITNGKFPDWINKNNPKLVLVKHDDFIPKEHLPTFNSCTIELNLHRIHGLSERFVYFNDDMLLNAPVTSEYFFQKGLPCDFNKETCFNVPIYTDTENFSIFMSILANIGIINAHFNRWDTVCQSPKRWFGFLLGLKGLIMSFILIKQRLFIGFSKYHTEQAYLKSTFEEVWEKEPTFLKSSCTRFREDVIANPYLFRYWQLAKNTFYPKKRKFACFQIVNKNSIDGIENVINNPHISSICLNDTSFCNEEDFEIVEKKLIRIFNEKYPQKSAFEL